MGAEPVKTVDRSARLRSQRVATAVFLGLIVSLVFVQPHGQAQTVDALPYTGGYLVTGNYVVGGVDLTENANPSDPVTGLSTGTIHMHGVPPEATIVAAYLYWEAITLTENLNQAAGVTFRGNTINLDDPLTVKKTSQALTGNAATCWSSGTPLSMTHFKADVLRFLPIRLDANDKPTTRRLVNDADLVAHGEPLHTVELPTRNGNQVPESGGASLVVVFVEPSQPLRKIVFYEGIYIQPSLTDAMTQTLRGFYKSSTAKSAKVTSILANGQPNNKERIFFNDGTNTQISGVDPIVGGSASERGWSQNETTLTPTPGLSRDVTYDVSSLMNPGNNSAGGYGETASLTVDHGQGGSYDCLTWGAVIFSTAVADIDPANDPLNPNAPTGDGIPDGLEDASSGLSDPDGEPLPNLNAMGASSSHRDLFVEFNAMWAAAGTSWGSTAAPYDSAKSITTVTDTTGHHHRPTPADLKLIGDRYAAHGITPHFDVGDWNSPACANVSVVCYHELGVVPHGDWVDDYTSTVADEYLVPSLLARGGEIVKEVSCDAASPTCFFPAYPGAVAWPYGVQSYKEFPVRDNGGELTLQQITDSTAEGYFNWNNGTHRRRFDRNRRGVFHYVLLAHLSAKRKSSLPTSPDYNVPTGRSGIAHLPGDTALVTLGRYDEYVGRPYVRAATIFHELGHNLDLWHGLLPATWGNKALGTATYFEPNCKPFPTTMSYIYQMHGLFDDDDNIHLDYSNVEQSDVFESSGPSDQGLSPATNYRSAWYAPAGSALATQLGASAASRYCSGLKFDPSLPVPAPMARVYTESSTGTSATIDWNGDLAVNSALASQDVNFDAQQSATLYGFNEWAALRLNQMSAGTIVRFFMAGDELVPGQGDELIPGQGSELLPGMGDELLPGAGDELLPGAGDELIPGAGDELIPGAGDELIPGAGLPELDDEATRGLGRAVPHAFKTCIIGESGCISPPNPDPQFLNHRVHSAWDPPVFDPVTQNLVSRKRGNAGSSYPWVDRPPTLSPTPTYDNMEQLPDGVQFTFRVRATFSGGALSGYSKLVSTATITARNDEPTANPDSYTTVRNRTLRITTRTAGVLGNDTDVDTPAALLKARVVTGSGPSFGTLTLNPDDGSFTYTPQNGFTGVDTFRYVAHNGTWTADAPNVPISADSNEATVTITVTAR